MRKKGESGRGIGKKKLKACKQVSQLKKMGKKGKERYSK